MYKSVLLCCLRMLWILVWNWMDVIVQIVSDLAMDFHLLSDIILINISLQILFVMFCTKLQTINYLICIYRH